MEYNNILVENKSIRLFLYSKTGLKEKIKMYELGYCLGIGLTILFLIAIFS